MPARKTMWTPEIVRQRIRVGVILNRLKNHMLGRIEMSSTQLQAAQILLKKALPDLAAVEHTGTLNVQDARELTDAELANIATAGSAGATEQADSSKVVREVH